MGRGTQGASSILIIHSRAGGTRARGTAVKEGRDGRGQGGRRGRREGSPEAMMGLMGYKAWEIPPTTTMDLATGSLWPPRTAVSKDRDELSSQCVEWR